MTDTNPRDLIQRLVEKLDLLHCQYNVPNQSVLIDEAYAYLDQPEPEGLTDEELLELMPETMRDEFSYAAKVSSDATGGQVKPGIFRVCLNHAALEYARVVIAADRTRWGRNTTNQEDLITMESITVQLTYFERNGRFYDVGKFIAPIHTPLYRIWENVRDMQKQGNLPGLIDGAGKEFNILVNAPGHPHAHPHIVMTTYTSEGS